jgi:hypothetical protein
MGGSDVGDAHASADASANFGEACFRPLLCMQGGQFLQQDSGFFAKGTIRARHHKRRNVPSGRTSTMQSLPRAQRP